MKTINTIILINIISFIITTIDKILAILNKRRISEKTLFILSFLGGAIGTFLSMIIFHHKTNKIKFKFLIPIAIVIKVILFYILLNK